MGVELFPRPYMKFQSGKMRTGRTFYTKREIDKIILNAPIDQYGATNIHYDPAAPPVETFDEWTQRKLKELSDRCADLIRQLDDREAERFDEIVRA